MSCDPQGPLSIPPGFYPLCGLAARFRLPVKSLLVQRQEARLAALPSYMLVPRRETQTFDFILDFQLLSLYFRDLRVAG